MTSDGGRIRARGSSYVDATLDLDGFEVIHDVFYLLEDLARGVIPFDTNSMVEGNLGFFLFDIPIKVKLSIIRIFRVKLRTFPRMRFFKFLF